jgi:transcription elongation factor Elf1
MTNPRPLKRELPDQFGADAKNRTEQDMWRTEVCAAFACPKCHAAKGASCTLKNGQQAFRCHSERSRKFIDSLKRRAGERW